MRLLRPAWVYSTDDAVWVPDEAQPVVAVLDPADGSLRDLLDWADLPAGPVYDPRGRCAAGGETFWVQQGDHLVGMMTTGVRWALQCPGLTLLAAGPAGAWLADLRHADSGLLFLVPATEGTGLLPTPVAVDRRVRGVRVRADGLEVEVLPPPLSRLAAQTTQAPWPQRVRTHLVTWAALDQPRLIMADHPEIAVPSPPPELCSWLPETGKRWRVDGQQWHIGWDPTPLGAVQRDVIATSSDGGQVHLGRATAVAVAEGIDRMWLILSRRRKYYVDHDRPHGVRVFNPFTGQVRTVLGGTGGAPGLESTTPVPDISAHCWKIPDSRPPGARAHEERWLHHFADLQHFWRNAETGALRPLDEGTHDAHATLRGSWPDTALQVTFRHPHYPDGVMRRTTALYDELGRPADLENADTLLMEDLGSNHISPVEEARNGILDI